MQMTGNTILVAGGTSGIGRALAEAFHDRGNRVAGRRQELLDQVTADRPGMAGIAVDLNDAASVDQLGYEVRARFPEMNVLIANAGISRFEDMSADTWDATDAIDIVQTNIVGLLRVAAALLPVLKSQPNASFIATSSALAFVHSWLTSLRHQLRKIPVEVLELSPPYVKTVLTGSEQKTDPRAMPLPDYVAQVMCILEQGNHPRGDILLKRDHARRWAERDGQYDAIFTVFNPD